MKTCSEIPDTITTHAHANARVENESLFNDAALIAA